MFGYFTRSFQLEKVSEKTFHLKEGGAMRLPAYLFLAVVGAGMFFSIAARPTIDITKDEAGTHLWYCNQTIPTNADVPIAITKKLVENVLDQTGVNSLEQSDTVTGKPSGFAGLTKEQTINTRTITFIGDAMVETPGDSIDATYWNIGPIQRVLNVPMLAVFIFGLLFALLVALRQAKVISPKFFIGSIFSILGFLLGIVGIGLLLKTLSSFFPIPAWATLISLTAAGLTGMAIGIFRAPNRASSEDLSKLVLKICCFSILPVFFLGLSWFGSWKGFSTMMVIGALIFAIILGSSKLIKRSPRKPTAGKPAPEKI